MKLRNLKDVELYLKDFILSSDLEPVYMDDFSTVRYYVLSNYDSRCLTEVLSKVYPDLIDVFVEVSPNSSPFRCISVRLSRERVCRVFKISIQSDFHSFTYYYFRK